MNIFQKTITSLNIEADSARLLTIKGTTVKKTCKIDIPEGFIKNTVIDNPQGVADTISDLFKQAKVSRQDLIVAMTNFRSVSRLITLPRLPRSKMDEAVMWAAEREMPVPLDTLYITWQYLDKTDSDQDVFLLGVPRDAYTQFVKTLWAAGISTKAIYTKLIALSQLISGENGIIIDLESDSISIIIQVDGIPVVMQTSLIAAENTVNEDRVKRVTDDLYRAIEYHNKTNPERSLNTHIPILITGSIVNDDIIDLIRQSTGHTVVLPSIPLTVPDDFSPSKYAVNAGLVLRLVNSRQSGSRNIINPDIRNSERFQI
ncbi:MAG: pilus assembly protein PilM [Dehalococcoidales bacterium]|nr:MAG: pilus assembly protein PilM [Dehalococcoidales bacterium]